MLQGLRILSLLAVSVAAGGCQNGPDPVPWRAEAAGGVRGDVAVTEAVAGPQLRSEVWVSYQIEVVSVDGQATDFRPAAPCVYYRIELPAGRRSLGLRLDYQAPVHRVRSASVVPMTVELAAGTSYRLLDLAAGLSGRDRRFTPFLRVGAPAEGVAGSAAPGTASAASK